MRAVCYSPEKRTETELETVATAKSPIKMKNFRQQKHDDLIITKRTDITRLDQDQMSFPYSKDLTASMNGQQISLSIHNLAGEQLICIKVEQLASLESKSSQCSFLGEPKCRESS